jgi:uncharacterized RDD family membrane protein YckC
MVAYSGGSMTASGISSQVDGGRASGRVEDGRGIVTPEAVVLELETAGIASRAFSGAIDVTVQFLALIVLVLLLLLLRLIDDVPSSKAAIAFSSFVIMFGYPLIWEMKTRGRTIGKSALQLRVVTIEGAPIRFRHAAIRSMGGIVDKWMIPGALIGTLFVLGTPGRQRIGDLLAGTMVIRDPERTQLPVGFWYPVPHGWENYAATIDPTALTVDQYTTLRAFLIRANELSADARASVAQDLADRVSTALHHQRPPQTHPETFLICVIARYQRQHFAGYRPH